MAASRDAHHGHRRGNADTYTNLNADAHTYPNVHAHADTQSNTYPETDLYARSLGAVGSSGRGSDAG